MQLDLVDAAFAVPEILAPMWIEVCMFGLAMAVYTVFAASASPASHSGWVPKGKAISPRGHIGRKAQSGIQEQMAAAQKSGTMEMRADKTTCSPPRSPTNEDKGKASERARMNREAQSRAEAIIAHGKEGRLEKALDVFEGVRRSNGTLTPLLYNCLLDACINCDNLATALTYFAEVKEAGLADVVSYNTVLKGRLVKGQIDEAHALLKEISASGLSATSVTYHCLLHAHVQRGDRRGMWKTVAQMQAAGHCPNAVTCSILLKAVVSPAWSADLQHIVKLADGVDLPADEVLFVSLVEASIRAKCLGLLSEKVKAFTALGSLAKLSSPTYGSMIKAYGQARDLHQVWQLWTQMVAQQVTPTPITIGCMIEALVMNGCTQDAWELTQTIWEDEGQRHSVNTVVYSTILKGFAMARQHEKVTALYEEMKERGIPRNTITFNTFLNSIARCGLMDRVPEVLEDMRSSDPKAVPDIVTYSTIIKGYCQSGCVNRALELLRQMCNESGLKPDEVMYNSLLDGCAREQRLDDALSLLAEMRAAGIAPSNYTLSILCKLLGRSRRLTQAFELVASISKEFGFQPNIQVYTCLIQACFHNRQVDKAFALHDRIVRDGVDPDEKTYTVLASGCLQAGAVDKAAMVVRCAFHLPCAMAHTKRQQGVESKCLRDVLAQLRRSSPSAAHTLEAELQARTKRTGSASVQHPVQRRGGRA